MLLNRPWNSYIGQLTYYAVQKARGEPVVAALRELEISQEWSTARLRTHQWQRLKTLIEHAYTLPFYKARFAAAGLTPTRIQTPSDFARLPSLTKNEIREKPERLHSPHFSGACDVVHTSGSSGAPLSITRSRISTAYARAAMYRAHRWHGLEMGDRELRLWGEPLHWKGRWTETLKDHLMNRSRMNVFSLPQDWAELFYAEIVRRQPRYLFGYATMMDRFARYAEANDRNLRRFPLKAIKTTSEPLRPEQARRLERLFGCSVLNEYGCTESGILATTCRRGRMHQSLETTYVELVPLPGSDWMRVVVTDLHNFPMPLLRYEVGDLARPAESTHCPCGLGLPLLGEIAGRKTELIEIPGGRTVHSLVLYYTICGMEQRGLLVDQARLIQRAPEHFVCQVVAPKNLSPVSDYLRRSLGEKLGTDVQIDIESVSTLPQMPHGKNADFVKAF